jgi:hypothetical protein
MARRDDPPAPPARRTPVTAAGRRLKASNPRDLERLRTTRPKWQEEAWDYYEAVGLIRRCYNLLAGVASRCDLRIGWYPEPFTSALLPDTPPETRTPDGRVVIDDTGTPVLPDTWPAPEVVEAAEGILQRLLEGFGGSGEFLHPVTLHLGIPGGSYVVATTTVDPATALPTETWEAFPEDAVTADGDTIIVRTEERGEPRRLPPDAFIARIWTRHPRRPEAATSDLRASLEDLEEYQLLRRTTRAGHRSRMGAGVALVSNSLEGTTRSGPDDAESDDPDEPGSFIDDLTEHMAAPLRDEADPATLVPLTISTSDEVIAAGGIRWVQFGRPIDPLSLQERDQLTTAIAQGLPLPPEAVLGVGDVNHWTAWQVSEDLFATGVAPVVRAICSGLTEALLWPMLVEVLRFPPALARRVCIWFDPTNAVQRPDPLPVIERAHNAYVVSDAAYRRVLPGVTEEDAPDADELARRLMTSRGPYTADMTIQELERLNDGEAIFEPAPAEPEPGAPPEEPGPAADTETETGPPPAPGVTAAAALVEGFEAGMHGVPVLAAAARLPARRNLRADEASRRLGELERTRVATLLARADAAVARAIERTGARARSKAQANPSLRASVAEVPAHMIPRALGRTVVAALGAGDEDAIRDELSDVAEWWTTIVGQAAEQSLRILASAGPESQATAVLALAAEFDAAVSTSATFFVDLLVDDTMRQLFDDVELSADQLGELDRRLRVTPENLRRALAVAGGDDAALTGAPSQPGGLTGGPTAARAAAAAGLVRDGYTWVYGAGLRGQPFDPHVALDGTTFVDWEDPALLVTSPAYAWVGAYFHPGDHPYCQCDAQPRFAPAAP